MTETAEVESEMSMALASDDSRNFFTPPDRQCCRWRLNAEPLILFTMIGFGLVVSLMPVFLLWARCVEMFSPDFNVTHHDIRTFCANLAKNRTFQDEVEHDIASWKVLLQVASSVPTLIVAPIMGAWADGAGGRKKPLLISMFGLVMYSGLQVFSTLVYTTTDVYPVLLAAEIGLGLTGGFMTFFATAFAIVTDDSRHVMQQGNTNVPYRVAIATALQAFGMTFGGVLASVCTKFIASDRAYSIGAAVGTLMVFLGLLYAIFFVRETHGEIAALQESGRYLHDDSVSERNWCKSLTQKGYEIIQVVVEKRPGWTRFCLCISLPFVFAEMLALDNNILLWIVKRPPLEWSDTAWITYSNYQTLMYTLGMMLWPWLMSLTSWLGQDSILIMIGMFSAALISLLRAFASTTELLYICGGLMILAGPISPGFRSFLPRMVRKEETARLMTLFGICISLTPILSAFTFNNIFKATMDTWPGFAFLVSGIVELLVFCGQIMIHCLMRPLWKEQSEQGFQPLIIDASQSDGDGDDCDNDGERVIAVRT